MKLVFYVILLITNKFSIIFVFWWQLLIVCVSLVKLIPKRARKFRSSIFIDFYLESAGHNTWEIWIRLTRGLNKTRGREHLCHIQLSWWFSNKAHDISTHSISILSKPLGHVWINFSPVK